MFRNYIKIAWRNLWNNKVFSLINIVSLSIGLSASFVIGFMVYHEFTFDKFHEDADRIYRVTSHFISPNGISKNSGSPSPLDKELKENVSGLELVSRFYTSGPANVKIPETGKNHQNLGNVIYADENFFKMFTFGWLVGSQDEPKLVDSYH